MRLRQSGTGERRVALGALCVLGLAMSAACGPAGEARDAADGDATMPGGVVLSDGPGGLALVSAPETLALALGRVSWLPVEIRGYRRPVAVTARTLIHTYVNDATPEEPGAPAAFAAGVLDGPDGDIALQTLRMRPHDLTLTFAAEGDEASAAIRLEPAVEPGTPLFGIHSTTPDTLPEPFVGISGPACDRCDPAWGGCVPCTPFPGDPPGTSRDVRCIKTHDKVDPCGCHPLEPAYDATIDASVRAAAPELQRYASQFLRNQSGGWTVNEYEPGRYAWNRLDWLLSDRSPLYVPLSPEERDYSPLLSYIMEGSGGWAICEDYPVVNPDGSVGFYEPDNEFLMERYGAYVGELVARYAPDLRFLETLNEPCYGFYLCPCLDDPAGPGVACTATGGRNQPVCSNAHLEPGVAQPHETEAFAEVYGEFLFRTADAAAEAMEEANPEAVLVAGALELTDHGLTATTEYMIRRGLLEHENIGVMIHQFPYWPFDHTWIDPRRRPENLPGGCGYLPDTYWGLNDGCETAPPLEDYTYVTPRGEERTVLARDNWRRLDEAIDVGEILADVEDLAVEMGDPGLLERFHLFDTELHGGFMIKDPTTNGGRATMAGLRIGATNAHQRFIGIEFIWSHPDPRPYNVMVKHLAGATPVHTPEAPLIGADYSGVVWKLFTRGDEDVIAVWSNAESPEVLDLALASGPTRFRGVTVTRVEAHPSPAADCSDLGDAERQEVDDVDVSVDASDVPPDGIDVAPLFDFYFISVISDRPGFGWLAGMSASPRPAGSSR